MRLLVDAQLPLRLVDALRTAGHDVVHTSDLVAGNRTIEMAFERSSFVELTRNAIVSH